MLFVYTSQLFFFLDSLLFCFLNHVVSPLHFRVHFPQEVSLPLFSLAIETLRTMFILVEGRVEEVSIVNIAKIFC